MTQIKKVKEYLDENDKDKNVFEYWTTFGFLAGLDKDRAMALAKLFESISKILIIENFSVNTESYAFPIARLCFTQLDYLIKNPYKFLNYLSGRVSQEKIDYDGHEDRTTAIVGIFDEIDLYVEIANEVKAMKL